MVSREELRTLATAALRKNQQFPLTWPEASEMPSSSERAYIEAASPAFILRLLRERKPAKGSLV